MISQYEHWNEGYKKYPLQEPKYDSWLDKYNEILQKSKNTPIIDLGCGLGNDSLYLSERGYHVISCDFSEEAIKRVKMYVPNAETMIFNMNNGLPFADCNAEIVIANLSLHYFSINDTNKIIGEISRVLKIDGVLLCRLNSTKDENAGAGMGSIIEKNYYQIGDKKKRFFDKETIEKVFSQWKIINMEEYTIKKYKLPKILWEVCLQK